MHEVVEVRSTALVITRVPSRTFKKVVFPALVVTTVCIAGAAAMILPAERVDVLASRLLSLWSSAFAAAPAVTSLVPEKHALEGESAKVASVPGELFQRALQLEAADPHTSLADGPREDHEKADSVARDLPAVREEVDAFTDRARATQLVALREAVTQSQEALDLERQNSDTLARDLAAARDQLKSFATQAAAAQLAAARAIDAGAQSAEALIQERKKSDKLLWELAAARDEVKALAARAETLQLASARATEASARSDQLGRQECKKADSRARRLAPGHARQVAGEDAELSAETFFWKQRQ